MPPYLVRLRVRDQLVGAQCRPVRGAPPTCIQVRGQGDGSHLGLPPTGIAQSTGIYMGPLSGCR